MILFNRLLTSFIITILFNYGCSTTEIVPQSRIPTTKTKAPRYETTDELKVKIGRLEKELTKDRNNTELLLQLSSLYLEIKDDDAAIQHMEQLKSLRFKRDPRLYGSLATIYKRKKQYPEAVDNFEIFRSLLPPTSATIKKIDQELGLLRFIIKSLEEPYEINLRPFSSDINTENSEYLPQFTMDDSTVIFTRRFFNQEDLFIARKSSTGYEIAAIEEINTLLNEGAHTLSADGQLLIFTHCDKKYGYGSCDLYRSRLTNEGKWSTPTNMGALINSRQWDSQPSLSADGRTLYFASKRTGGNGGSDIWTSKMKDDGKWDIPVNLGAAINTNSDDESPFIHADGKTLYFRSKGYPGLGNFDIYKSTKTDSDWSDVVNLGSPINTTGEDGALVVSLDGTRGYYATDRYNNTKLNHLDLFEFDLPTPFRPGPMTFVKGRVIDEISNVPINAQITITYLDGSDYSTFYNANYNGEFLAAIPVGNPALINIKADNYIFYSDHISFDEVKYSVDAYNMNIALAKINRPDLENKKSKPVILKNIFFASGSAKLLSVSNNEIEILYNLLMTEPDISIEIIGHTDNIGSEYDNMQLSTQRAEAVRLELIRKGIVASRLTATGRGENQPINSNETEEGRSNNRRTEFIIIN